MEEKRTLGQYSKWWFHTNKLTPLLSQKAELQLKPYILFLSFLGFELLYQPEVVRLYLSILTESQNFNTLEAAAGALQNLSAGNWTVSETSVCVLAIFHSK